jgi:putative peptide zinc metalloprotease protein
VFSFAESPSPSSDSTSAPPDSEQRPLIIAIEVPERPALAPGVELSGEMQGSGFKDRQWLIQRDGRFLQVTELLYRVLEHTDGEHTLEEIAAALTQSTEWSVSSELVGQIIEKKLLPLGLVRSADGSVPSSPHDRERSALQVSLRRRMVSARSIERIAKILQFLFAPPVMIPLLLVISIAYGWLYLIRGVSDTIRAALYAPGGLLLTFALVIASGLVHEFGHATALRYGGGRARGMGVGFYIVYPTFYTDTTDAYRLGRWARLRTDLGGIYFHLIFGLLLIGLYLITRQEILLAVVLVVSADILYQLIPYVRLDGYWAIADLTGIPDLFSQMRPFLRSALPSPVSKKGIFPELKPWVKRTFALYILLTIPVLAFFGAVFLWGFPQFVANAWNAVLSQGRVFSMVQHRGDFLSLAAVSSQIILLALSLLATVYFLYALLKKPVKALWNWSKRTPARLALGSVAALAGVAFLAVLWAPRLILPEEPLPPGVEAFEIRSRVHVTTPVAYPQSPPVGGDHAPIWQNCGFYDAPIANENGVHSLEHGSIWITYRPGLAPDQVALLRRLARNERYVLVSPYPDLPSPVVVSAWGRQARLRSANDPLLEQFIHRFRYGRQAPESGGPCTDGIGRPK